MTTSSLTSDSAYSGIAFSPSADTTMDVFTTEDVGTLTADLVMGQKNGWMPDVCLEAKTYL